MRSRLITWILLFFVCGYGFAQLSTNELPISFNEDLTLVVKKRSAVPIATMPQLNMAAIEKEDREDEDFDIPPRFGYQHKVNYDTNNSGIWYELPNGDKLWQLNIVCPGALSVNLCYDKFWIPEGGKFFIYSKDKKYAIGAFTSKNNKGDRENIRGFATGLVYGDDVVLEYYQPKEVTTDAIISLNYVIHGYRYISFGDRFFGDSGDCQVNINCVEGLNWQYEKKAIALLLLINRVCTGSLLTTTKLSGEPFFLTANHCIAGLADAVDNPYLDFISLAWNYESPGCVNPNIAPTSFTTSGAIVVANSAATDFALMRLSEDPKNISGYTPYYLGWDHSGAPGNPGVCIHHPLMDVKKISTVAFQPTSSEDYIWDGPPIQTHWEVTWAVTENGHGTTEDGSSGSPLLNATHKVIGQLQAGRYDCTNLNSSSIYGKFNLSWTGIADSTIHRRLSCWLDSLGTGQQAIEGLLVLNEPQIISADKDLYSNIRITNSGQLTIQGNVMMMGNSSIFVKSGGKLIIDGGTLSNASLILEPGASLQIINGGMLETRTGFEAPIGALVEIEDGRIS